MLCRQAHWKVTVALSPSPCCRGFIPAGACWPLRKKGLSIAVSPTALCHAPEAPAWEWEVVGFFRLSVLVGAGEAAALQTARPLSTPDVLGVVRDSLCPPAPVPHSSPWLPGLLQQVPLKHRPLPPGGSLRFPECPGFPVALGPPRADLPAIVSPC